MTWAELKVEIDAKLAEAGLDDSTSVYVDMEWVETNVLDVEIRRTAHEWMDAEERAEFRPYVLLGG